MSQRAEHPAPRAAIISTGSEIVQGLYADTNAMELSRLLKRHGFRVVGHAAVPDEADRIESAVRATFDACELLVITGGLGPTEDDLNREILAAIAGVGLRHVHRAEALMRSRFARHGRTMPERNRKQAFVPEGATPWLNHWGTAPGFVLPAAGDRPMIVALPGVPHEWRAMMERYFAPQVLAAFPDRPSLAARVFCLAGVTESEVNDAIRPLFGADARVEVGILAQSGVISVRLLARTHTQEEAAAAVEALALRARGLLPGESIFWEGEEPRGIEQVVVEAFHVAGRTVAVAESCTGGGVARRLTNVPGSSEVLLEAAVTYSNEAKVRRLGVQPETLAREGAVSEACAREMAEGMLRESGADAALAITGIAGPGGGTPEKPVGLVWFGLASRGQGTVAVKRLVPGDREGVRRRSEIQALEMLRRWICGARIES